MRIIAQLMVWLCLITLPTILFAAQMGRRIYPIRYAPAVMQAAHDYHLPRNLILATMKEESGFREDSNSRASAEGLMQLLPSTSAWIASKRGVAYRKEVMLDPSVNIDYGSWYLRYLIDQLGSDTLALEAYNAGITNVRDWEKQNPGYVAFGETDQFVKRVKRSVTMYDQLYGSNWEKQ